MATPLLTPLQCSSSLRDFQYHVEDKESNNRTFRLLYWDPVVLPARMELHRSHRPDLLEQPSTFHDLRQRKLLRPLVANRADCFAVTDK